MPAKIMVCYSDAGNGPFRASAALSESLHDIYGQNVDVMLLDVLKETTSFGFLSVRLYNYLLTKSLTWNSLALRLFYRSELIKSGALLQFSVRSMSKLLDKVSPDVLVFTNPWVIGYVLRAVRMMKKPKPKTVSMLIDLGCGQLPPSWFDPGIDMYTAPTTEAYDELLSFGASASQIKVLGMPISPDYLHDYGGKEIHSQACDQCAGSPSILVMGGRSGTRNTFEIIKYLLRADFHLRAVVLCGKNSGLKRKIERYLSKNENTSAQKHVKVFGFVADPCPIMRASDIVITKPGALTVSEVAALGKGLILDTYPTVMGQEIGNVKYVESRGLGLVAHSVAEIPKLITLLREDKGRILASRLYTDYKIAGTNEIAKAITSLALTKTQEFCQENHGP